MEHTVYLAGGMKSDWREKLIEEFERYWPHIKVNWICPGEEDHFQREEDYTPWDLFWCSRADVTFAYMEADNPSGVGLAVEAATSKAHGRFVIFVDESGDPKMGMVRELADHTTHGFLEGEEYLATLLGGAGVKEYRK